MTDTAEQLARRMSRHSWLDHPVVAAHYRERGLVAGLPWEQWVCTRRGRPVRRSLEVGCAAGQRSLYHFEQRLAESVDGIDWRESLVDEGERLREDYHAPGSFRVLDLNSDVLRTGPYELIFTCHALHQFVALEHVMEQVYDALEPDGLFVLEGYTGPTRFQWTDVQMDVVRAVVSQLPDNLVTLRWHARKTHEGRPDPDALASAAPLEAIRSAEIPPLFERYFEPVVVRTLGGTVQNLLYNGIIHNFPDADPEVLTRMRAVIELEDTLIDQGRLPSDFSLLIGRRR